MLNVMRENLRHLKWILWIVALSMVAYLGAFFSCDDGPVASGPWAARINGTPISQEVFRQVARNIDRNYRDLFGENYDQIRGQIRVGTQAIQRLIEDEVVLQDARRLGLVASKEEIAELIRQDPRFQDADGSFVGKERYVEAVNRGYRGGVAGYEHLLTEQILIQKWGDLVGQPARVDEAELERTYRRRNEKTAIDYVLVTSADQQVDTEIDADEERAWYEEHRDDYHREEGRRIRYVVVERDAQLAKVEISEDEVAAWYEANRANYSHPEQRSARHILLRTDPSADDQAKQALREQAEALAERIRGGEDFAELARSESQDPISAAKGGDLGFFARGDMVPPFETAAFSTPVGELAPVAESQFGFHVIEVTGAREAGATPLEEVRDSIVSSLRVRRAQEGVVSEAQRLRSALDSPDQLAVVAEREGLEVREAFVTAGDPLPSIGASPEFLSTVSTMEAGGVSAPLRVAAGMALVVVEEVVAPGVAPLEEVSQRVRTDILNHRAKQAAVEKAYAALTGDDLSLADSAARLGLEIQGSGDLGPGAGLPGLGGATAELQDLLFGDDVEVGARGVLEVPAGALLYEVTSRTPFDSVAFELAREDLRRELLAERRASIRQAMIDQLRAQQEILVNDEIVRRIDES